MWYTHTSIIIYMLIFFMFRFPYATFEIQYRYRFQAPDHSTYGISWISFITEKLENYNWNYMDHYLCARGDMDYDLHEVKFKKNNTKTY